MKNLIKYIPAFAAAALLSASCNILEQSSPSTFDAQTIYSNYALAEGTIYSIAETFCGQNSYRGRFLPWYGFNTDIEWYNTYKSGDDKSQIATYDTQTNSSQFNTASNGATNNPWALMYAGIERANLAIDGIRQYADPADEDLKYLLGEALTMRAMIYYDLIKAWGDVPARFSPTEASTIYIPKTDRDVIFKQILADLDEACDYLPWPGVTTQTQRTDRVNKAFAKGLYARIALAASGYALRPEDGKVGTGDPGSVRLSSDEELAKSVLYPTALQHLKDVIESGKCSLESDFRQYWYNQNNLNNLTAGPAYETLYVIPFGANRGRWNFTFAVKSEGSSISGGADRGGDAGPTPTFFFKYADNDVRRDITCVNYKWEKDGNLVPSGIGKWYFGKYRFEWMDAQPYGGGNDDGVKPVVMRYADILLMASEIANELDYLEDAKTYFTPVHDRACGEGSSETYLAGVDKEGMFSKIVDERAFEFCGEFLRKGDLIRWNMLKSKMDETTEDMKKLRDLVAPYDFLSGDIYYQTGDDGISLTIYGLKNGESAAPAGEWEKEAKYITYDDSKKPNEGLGVNRITLGMYVNNPEEYMYWPIFDCNKTDSQGTLVNDYKY